MIVIYIIYVSEIPYHNEGGASRSTRTLLAKLVARGHKCLSISRIPGERHVDMDGVHCLRTAVPEDWLSNILKHDGPRQNKIILTQHVQTPWVYDLAIRHRVPLIMRVPSWEMFCNDVAKFTKCSWRCAETHCQSKRDFKHLFQKSTAIMSISDYVAGAVKRFYGLDSTVITPFVERDQYLIDVRKRKFVTMIRGHTVKGADFFIDLAKRMPDVSFALAGECDPHIKQRAGECPNILRIKHNVDIRPVYAQTSIYLAPVVWAEPFGRTLVEAMMNGIPVIGSDRGALPEVLGDAGVILPLEHDLWQNEITKFATDDNYYNDISAKCAKRSLDLKFNINHQVDKFEQLAETLVSSTTKAVPASLPVPMPVPASISLLDKQKTVLFGPCISELGWETMSWQSWCRKEAAKYKKVYACSFIESEYLYSDFAEFIPHDGTVRELWGPDKRDVDFSVVNFDIPADVDEQILPIWALDSKGTFARFGSVPDDTYSYLIHARGIETHGQSFKNYPRDQWDIVVSMLPENAACIGTIDDMHIAGTVDLRGIPLSDLANYMSGSDVIIGGSSGPMVFAGLCGTPRVVWGPSIASGDSLEKRFKQIWNPFNTQVAYVTSNDWRPNPLNIVSAVFKILESPKAVN